jgi:hypothetical protein
VRLLDTGHPPHPGGRDIERLFAARKRELERCAVETDQQLASINHYLQTLGEDPAARYEVRREGAASRTSSTAKG